MPEPAHSTARLAWLDYAKAIGIALVVFAHASRSIGRTPGLSWSATLQMVDGIVYAFHMPLFFMLAGFAAGLARRNDASSVGRSLLWGVIVPYLVWSVVWIGIKIALPDAANVPLTWSDLAGILTTPVEHMWFLYHLFFMRLGWYAIERLEPLGSARHAGAIIGAVVLARLLTELAPAHDTLIGFLLNFAIYGFGLAALPLLVEKIGGTASGRLMGLGALAWIAGLSVPSETGRLLATLLPAVGGALVVVGIARALPAPTTLPMRLLAFVGEASLAIYVLHLIVGAAIRAALAKSGMLSETTLLVLATLGGLVIPALAYWLTLAVSVASGRPFLRYLGLGTATGSPYLGLHKSGMAARAAA